MEKRRLNRAKVALKSYIFDMINIIFNSLNRAKVALKLQTYHDVVNFFRLFKSC